MKDATIAVLGMVLAAVLFTCRKPAEAVSPVVVRESAFSSMHRYQADDAARSSKQNDVIFMGDSITDFWAKPENGGFFPGRNYVNRGIKSDVTPSMLARFRQDVIDLHPRVVVILGGTNDLTVPGTSVSQVTGNLESMAELAKVHGVRIVIASILPIGPGTASAGMYSSPESIAAVNAWSKSYCAQTGCTYLDYFTSMVDAGGKLRNDLSNDGVHPNAKGYAVMAPLAEAALQVKP